MNKRIKKKKRKQRLNRMNAVLVYITKYYPKKALFLRADDILKLMHLVDDINKRNLQKLNEDWARTNNAFEECRSRITGCVDKNFDISILPDKYAFK